MSLPFRSLLMVAVFVRLRKALDDDPELTQSELGRRCGVCQGTISRWLMDETVSGSATKLERALRALGGRIKIVPAKPVRVVELAEAS